VLKGIVHLSPETPDDLADDLSQRPLNEARRASVGEMSEQLLIWLRFSESVTFTILGARANLCAAIDQDGTAGAGALQSRRGSVPGSAATHQ
jgi:hypothetical protein